MVGFIRSRFNVTVDATSLKVSDQLSPKILTPVKGAVQDSLVTIKNRWQQELKPFKSRGLEFNSIIYPIDSEGFAGIIQWRRKFPNLLGLGKSLKMTKFKSPFRHSTPSSNGRFGATKDVYKVTQKLSNGGHPGVSNKSQSGYQHKKQGGLTRIVRSYQSARQSTSRRISDPLSWRHPDFKGVRVADNLMPFAHSTFMSMLTTNLNGII